MFETEPPYCEEAQITQRGHILEFQPINPAMVLDRFSGQA